MEHSLIKSILGYERRLFNDQIFMLMSYPRSGSNFLQNLLNQTTETHSQSLYSKPKLFKRKLTIKSHAFSQNFLEDELNRLYHGYYRDVSTRRVVIVRDPRDVFISFKDFVEVRKGIKVDQRRFLDYSYTYCTYQARTPVLNRRAEFTAKSNLDAYREFIYEFWALKGGEGGGDREPQHPNGH